ncbi:MAG: phosphatase PAP2 family protein [Actinomycetota bacterium]|nr:phosphatase PAP2 family protein [Actinomycetota bacterium]
MPKNLRPLTIVVAGFALALGVSVPLGELVDGPFAQPVLDGFDRPLVRWFADLRSDGLTTAMRVITAMGGTIVALVVLTAGALTSYVVTRSPRWLAFFAGVMGGGLQLAAIVKPIVGRARPLLDAVYLVSSDAWPSGHAAVGAACWGALAFFGARKGRSKSVATTVWLIGGIIIVLVGISRVYLGVHWPTDVLAGWALGGFWVTVVAVATRPPGAERLEGGGILPA